MKKKYFGISYFFTPVPKAGEVAKMGRIEYKPLVVYLEEEKKLTRVRSNKVFQVTSNSVTMDNFISAGKKSFYIEMQKRARAAQERIISEYICTIILEKTREFPECDLTFLIRDEFQTEKIVGRLGYLGLPIQRLHIMFVSCDLSSFMRNDIEYYSVPPKNDLHLLFQEKYRGQILGPYPDDDRISMLRTYYCTFKNKEIYPIRINLFGQMLKKEDLNIEKEHIKDIFMTSDKLESYPISGGVGEAYTRLPKILVDCENFIEQERKKYE